MLACAGYQTGSKARTRFVTPLEPTDCYISPFAAIRGQGYGAELLKELEHLAQEQGYKQLVFDTHNGDLNPYYTKYGCVEGQTIECEYLGELITKTRYTKLL